MEKTDEDFDRELRSGSGCTKFARLFFSAGISGNPVPLAKSKKLTHVVTQLYIFKGSPTDARQILDQKGDSDFLQTTRFMHLNQDYYLAIKYEETIKSL